MKESRLEELVTKLLYGIIEDGAEEAYVFFRDNLELTEEECAFFGLSFEDVQNAGEKWAD